ncbi:DNA polymerase III subunit alpha [Granulicella sp. L60]|uniref:DNA polymerase III subunit alpha n=1 Tax=Granulicella sp. L60 TaxID=1641866 RepID=UPI00131DAAFB|nr:error-prone DNA polymerase [Granulicella sp. L60]
MAYVELHAHSAFSFLAGASEPETLAEVCAARGISAIGLLDQDGFYGSPRMHMAAQKLGLKAHVGAEVSVEDVLFGEAGRCRYSLLAETRTGYQNLCRLITTFKLRENHKGEGAATFSELEEHAGGLVCLTGGEEGPLYEALQRGGYDEGLRTVERMVHRFGQKNVFVELQKHRNRQQAARNRASVSIARSLHLPLLATNGVLYATPQEREIQDVMTAIRLHTTLEGAGTALQGNAERYLRSGEEMEALFADLPEAVQNTVQLSDRLQFELKDLGYELPRYPVPQGETMMSFLRERTREGWKWRYGTSTSQSLKERAHRQVERELALIERLDLAGYFLIVWDLVRFCKEKRILAQGRGSAANSAVCYSLGITIVDPVGMDLLFERFLSEQRGEWPDIDLDLPSGDQREEVIQYLYKKYGQRGAAMTANVITYRAKSAAREVGKVLGLAEKTLEEVSSAVSSFEWKAPTDTLEEHFRQAGLDLTNPTIRTYLSLSTRMQDRPRHLGQHSGGMVVCQGQLDSVVPLEPASMPGRVVLQWDKDDCSDFGLIKFDLLGLGMMAVIDESLSLIRKVYEEDIDLAHLPQDDPDVYRAIQEADTIGVFQIESRAQMSALPRTRPKCFYDIVKQEAIIRPGPMQGEFVNPYIERVLGRQAITYPHPLLEPILARTLGVPLFQEQILKIAMVMADLSGGEAEQLRRAMGSKRSVAKVQAMESLMRDRMTVKEIVPKVQDEIIRIVQAVGHYMFPESHAASFASLTYVSAYLREHYRAAFTAAILNQQPMGFYSPDSLVSDAQRHGLKAHYIDINASEWRCTLELSNDLISKPQLRVGFRYVRDLRRLAGEAIVHARNAGGPFVSVADLWQRVPELRGNELTALAEIGALNSTYVSKSDGHRRTALWDSARAIQSPGPLFAYLESENSNAPLDRMTNEERLLADYQGMGMTTGPHPLFYSRSELNGMGVTTAVRLRSVPNDAPITIAGFAVTTQRPGTAKGFLFLTLEDETGSANAVVTPKLYEQYRILLNRARYLLIKGKMQNLDGVRTIRAKTIHSLNVTSVAMASRSFR